MTEIHVKLEGMDSLVKRLKANTTLDAYKHVVKTYTNQLASQTQMLMNQKYKGHWEWDKEAHGKKWVYPTGTTRRSTIPIFEDNGLTGVVAPSTFYFPFLEFGTRYMNARPTLHPAFEIVAPQFTKAIREKVRTNGK